MKYAEMWFDHLNPLQAWIQCTCNALQRGVNTWITMK